MKSGQHHPDGMMWIRTPSRNHKVLEEKVPLISVAPTILKLYGLDEGAGLAGEPVLETAV